MKKSKPLFKIAQKYVSVLAAFFDQVGQCQGKCPLQDPWKPILVGRIAHLPIKVGANTWSIMHEFLKLLWIVNQKAKACLECCR